MRYILCYRHATLDRHSARDRHASIDCHFALDRHDALDSHEAFDRHDKSHRQRALHPHDAVDRHAALDRQDANGKVENWPADGVRDKPDFRAVPMVRRTSNSTRGAMARMTSVVWVASRSEHSYDRCSPINRLANSAR